MLKLSIHLKLYLDRDSSYESISMLQYLMYDLKIQNVINFDKIGINEDSQVNVWSWIENPDRFSFCLCNSKRWV